MEYPEIRKLAQESLSKEDQIRLANDILNNLKEESSSDNAIDTSTEWWKCKAEALDFLKDNGMDTPEFRKMIMDVEYLPWKILIWWVPRAPDNLKAKDIGINYTVDTQDKPADYTQAHVFKWEWEFADEDYFTFAAIEKIQNTGKIKLPTDVDMENTLKALPWYTKKRKWEKWSVKILSILLWAQMSGWRLAGNQAIGSGNGWLRSASPLDSNTNKAWALLRSSSKGILGNYNTMYALPLRSLA